MVLLTKPRTLAIGNLGEWKSVEHDVLFDIQKYQLGELGQAARSVKVMLLKSDEQVKNFRVVTRGKPLLELSVGDTVDEVLNDAEMLRHAIIGVGTQEVPKATLEVLASLQATSAEQGLREGEEGRAAPVAQWSEPELIKQIEPWAVTLLENADRLRYACYALKIATSFAAESSTAGLGGGEMVELCFVAVDAVITSSWFTWFAHSVLDDAPESNVVQNVMCLDFDGGPQAVVSKVNSFCGSLSSTDAAQVTRLAMSLKRRIAVLVGDLVSLFVPNDCSVSGVLITELLVRLRPANACDALQRLVSWYDLIPKDKRNLLEDGGGFTDVLRNANSRLQTAVMEEYDRPLHAKALGACKRHVPLAAAHLGYMAFPPAGPVIVAMAASHVAGSVAICSNCGRDSCAAVFQTMDKRMPEAVNTLRKALAMAFGTVVLLGHCADAGDDKMLKK